MTTLKLNTSRGIISVHSTVPGNNTGIGDMFKQSIFKSIMSSDSYGLVYDCIQKGGVGLYRPTRDNNDFDFDTAENYTASAATYWAAVLDHLAGISEFDIQNTVLVLLNEIDKNQMDWLNDWGVDLCLNYAIPQGYKVCLYNFNPGEPEPSQWPLMRGILEVMAQNPDQVFIGLHEYSLNNEELFPNYPYLIGRFGALFNACDAMRIARPSVFITEWGYGRDSAKAYNWGWPEIEEVMQIYKHYPQIKGMYFWALNAGWGNLAEIVNNYMKDMAGKNNDWIPGEVTRPLPIDPDPDIPPPTDPPPGNDCPYYSNIRVRYNLLPQDTTRQELSGITGELHALRNTFGYSHDDGIVLVAHGRQSDSTLYVYEPERRNTADMAAIEASGIKWQPVYFDKPPPNNPPGGKTLNVKQYQIAVPTAFRVVKNVKPGGEETNEDVQDWTYGNQHALKKNVNAEFYQFVNGYRERIQDTSPGNSQFYRMAQSGSVGGRVNPEIMEAGKEWTDSSTHNVMFYNQSNCHAITDHPSNGDVVSKATATLARNVTLNTYGQNLVFDEILYLETNNGEQQMYGVYNGVNVGWVGWRAEWGTAECIEIYFDRGRLTERPDVVCGWI